MRRFFLERKSDLTGMSGTGVVAEGVEFTNGHVAMSWKSEFHSVSVFNSISVVEKLHSHNGKDLTRIVWVDNLSEDVEAKAEELRKTMDKLEAQFEDEEA